ncbi:MAG: nucleotidyltransferase family protein [Candidatus Omnitrophica bacterium]|nr:nucleotidyltransferase family protein [Candidatus Omnitrophota bacterium]
MKVIILAAGGGTRMKEVFPDVPKPLIPVKGKPIIEHLIDQYKGFEILINVSLKERDKFKYLGLQLLVEDTPIGNAGAIKYFSKELGKRFIATHTDVYSDLDPRRLAEVHRGCATMVVKDLSRPKNFGVVTHEGSLITGFTRRRLVNCGIYSFSQSVMSHIGSGFQDFDKDLFPKLIKKRKIHIYEHKGIWEDIGTKEYWNK